MADTKITALTALTAADPANDVIPIVDVSDTTMAASGTTKKISVNNILGASGTATLASASISGDLTARTTGLTVNSSGVGIGTNSQSSFLGNSPKKLVIGDGTQTPALTLYGGSTNVGGLYYADGTVGNQAYRGYIEYDHNTDSFGLGLSGSLAMTLNSTGLGVGGSAAARIHAIDSSGVCGLFTRAAAPAAALSAAYITAPVSSGFSNNPVYSFWYQNTGISNPASECFAIRTSSTDRLYIDSSGNVGIGVTPSGTIYSVSETRLVVKGTSNSFAGTLAVQSKGTTNAVTGFLTAGDNTNEVAVGSTTNSPLNFYTNNAYKASIDASGNLLVGRTTALGGKIGAQVEGGNGSAYLLRHNGATAGKYRIFAIDSSNNGLFYDQNNVGMFMADAGTSWVATSDETQKDIIEPISNAILKVGSLRAVIGKFKTDVNSVRRSFLIAQDVKTALPEAVHQKDGLLGLSYTDVIPLLVAAIKELTAEVNALKNA